MTTEQAPPPSVRKVSSKKPLTNREKDVVHALAAVMWVDGHAAPAERKLSEQVIRAFDPSEDEWREMMTWLSPDHGATIGGVELERLSEEQKEVLMTDAILISMADDVQLPSEKKILERLAERLGFSKDDLARLAADAREEGALSLPSNALVDRVSLPMPEPKPE
jgi:uncharacterized tellurite resistance protein B-like protein